MIYNQRKSTFLLSYVFGICYRCHSFLYFNNKVCFTKNTTCNRNHLQLRSLAFQNRHLNGTNSISDIKLSLFQTRVYEAYFQQCSTSWFQLRIKLILRTILVKLALQVSLNRYHSRCFRCCHS